MWGGVKDRKHLSGHGEMGVSDVFRKASDHDLVNGVINMDSIGDAFVI